MKSRKVSMKFVDMDTDEEWTATATLWPYSAGSYYDPPEGGIEDVALTKNDETLYEDEARVKWGDKPVDELIQALYELDSD